MCRYYTGFEATRAKIILTLCCQFGLRCAQSQSHREEKISCVEECSRAGNDFKSHKAAANTFCFFTPYALFPWVDFRGEE